MRSTTLILLYLLSFSLLRAQFRIGVDIGVTQNYFHTTFPGQVEIASKPLPGKYLTIPICYSLSRSVQVEVDPSIIDKSFTLGRTGSYQGIYTDYKNTYLQLPVLVKFDRGERWKYNVGVGLYSAYWWKGRINGKTADIFSAIPGGDGNTYRYKLVPFQKNYVFDSEIDKRVEFGAVGACGLSRSLNRSLNIGLNARLYYSFTNMNRSNSVSYIPSKNRTWVFSVAFIYSILK